MKGCKMSFFSDQLIYSSIEKGSRTAIKKLTSDGLIVIVKWHQEFIETKFILKSSILLSILWACPSWIKKVNLVPNEAKLIIVVTPQPNCIINFIGLYACYHLNYFKCIKLWYCDIIEDICSFNVVERSFIKVRIFVHSCFIIWAFLEYRTMGGWKVINAESWKGGS